MVGYVPVKRRGKQGDIMTWEETLSRWLSPRQLSSRGRARQRKRCSQRRQDRGQRGSEKCRECGLPFPLPCPHLNEVGGAKEKCLKKRTKGEMLPSGKEDGTGENDLATKKSLVALWRSGGRRQSAVS